MTLAGGPTAAGGVESLPSLRFRTAFRNYEPVVRAATLVASVVVVLAGLGVAAACLAVISDPRGAADSSIAKATGVAGGPATTYCSTPETSCPAPATCCSP